MTYRYCGICGKCGSATYVPEVWHGAFPPRPECIDCNRKSPPVKAPTMEAVRQEIKETRDLVNKIREDRKDFEEAAFGGTMGPPRNRLEDTLREIETRRAVGELQRAVDANLDDVPGTQRAAKELEKAVNEALKDEEGTRMDDLDARMNRLEMMMITASEQLTRVKEVVNHLSDVLKEMREPVEKVVY